MVLAQCPVPYLKDKRITVNDTQSVVDTGFDIRHAEIDPILSNLVKDGDWNLGPELSNGHEFLVVAKHSV